MIIADLTFEGAHFELLLLLSWTVSIILISSSLTLIPITRLNRWPLIRHINFPQGFLLNFDHVHHALYILGVELFLGLISIGCTLIRTWCHSGYVFYLLNKLWLRVQLIYGISIREDVGRFKGWGMDGGLGLVFNFHFRFTGALNQLTLHLLYSFLDGWTLFLIFLIKKFINYWFHRCDHRILFGLWNWPVMHFLAVLLRFLERFRIGPGRYWKLNRWNCFWLQFG